LPWGIGGGLGTHRKTGVGLEVQEKGQGRGGKLKKAIRKRRLGFGTLKKTGRKHTLVKGR